MTDPTTRIGTPTSETTRFRMRGKDVLAEIVGHKSFAEAFYFIVSGNEPTAGEARSHGATRLRSRGSPRCPRHASPAHSTHR